MSKTSAKKDVFVGALQLLYSASHHNKIPSYYEDILDQFADAQKQQQKYTEGFVKQIDDMFISSHAMMVKTKPTGEALAFVKDIQKLLGSMKETDYDRILGSVDILDSEPSKTVKRMIPSYQALDIHTSHKRTEKHTLATEQSPSATKTDNVVVDSDKSSTPQVQNEQTHSTPAPAKKMRISATPDQVIPAPQTPKVAITAKPENMKVQTAKTVSSVTKTTPHKPAVLKSAQSINNGSQAQKNKKRPVLMIDVLKELDHFLANRNQ
jgi:hypothetical protein